MAPQTSLVTTGLLASTIVFTVLATIAVVLRFIAARRSDHGSKMPPDHWLILLALVMVYGYTIQTICAAALGGVNQTKLDPLSAAKLFPAIAWSDLFLVTPASAFVKISVLLFYKRLFVLKNFRLACNIEILLIAIWCISTIFCELFTTTPIYAAWYPVPGFRLNYNYSAFSLAIFGSGIVLDVITLCLPLPVIHSLHMSTKRKWKVVGIFWLGIFSVICAAVRLYYAYIDVADAAGSGTDSIYTVVTQTALWSRLEPSSSLIAACLPTYGPILPHAPHFLKSWIQSAADLFSLQSHHRHHWTPSETPTNLTDKTATVKQLKPPRQGSSEAICSGGGNGSWLQLENQNSSFPDNVTASERNTSEDYYENLANHQHLHRHIQVTSEFGVKPHENFV